MAPRTEPWLLHEDEHVLVVHKPSGVNTHRADIHAQDGMHDWVQRQRPRESLSVLHRLDKATSGVLVFGKSADANRSLTAQFEQRTVHKTYELLTGPVGGRAAPVRCDEPIDGASASTEFEVVEAGATVDRYVARPHTGRTHQVRIHAAVLGMPIVGDAEHGGREAPRLFLHAAGLRLDHPDGRRMDLRTDRPASFDQLLAGTVDHGDARLRLLVAAEARAALFDPADTDAHLWVDRHHDGFPDLRIERLGAVALVLDYRDGAAPFSARWVDAMHDVADLRGVFVQRRPRVGSGTLAERVSGDAPARFDVIEHGIRYRIDLEASATSSGLFLDQRETRRELRSSDLSGRTVLNTFAHTGSLSVAAALAGAETLTLDLSKRYLEWARENLRLNDVDPADHDFIYGDALEWMERLAKKGRTFDLVLVDPPSSSTNRKSKGAKRWSVDRDLHALVASAGRLCSPGGTLFVSTNYRRMTWSRFLGHVERGLTSAHRSGTVETRTLPLDHRSGSGDPPYLKAAWVRLDR